MSWNAGIACMAYILSGLMFMELSIADTAPEFDIAGKDAVRLVNIAEFASTPSSVSLAEAANLDFRTLTRDEIAQGLTSHEYWLRFSVVNTSDEAQRWVLHGDSNYLDVLQVYYRDRQQVEGGHLITSFSEQYLSDREPFASRALHYRKLAYSHTTAGNAATDLYVAVRYLKADALRLDFSVYDHNYFDARTKTEYLLLGSWYGVLAILLFAAALVALVMHQRSAWYYAAFLMATALMWGLLNGLGFQYLWPQNIYLQNEGFHLSYLLFAFFAFQFSSSFLRLPQTFPRLSKAVRFAQLLMVMAAALRLAGVYETVLVLSYLALASTMLLPVIGLLAWRHGQTHARWFCAAWLVYSISLTLAVLNAATAFPGWSMDVALGVVQAGAMVEVVLLMVAIGERVLQIDSDRREALDLAHLDPLTGLGNRRRLVQAYEQLDQRFGATGQPVFLGLLDLDQFKEINDRYGHEAGDTILKELAIMLQQDSRGGDTCVRYGGDEFVLLLQAENIEAARLIVERIRTRFAGRPTVFHGQLIRHTLSAGVITAIDRELRLSPGEVLMKVDKALYEAKEAGRNRTIVRA